MNQEMLQQDPMVLDAEPMYDPMIDQIMDPLAAEFSPVSISPSHVDIEFVAMVSDTELTDLATLETIDDIEAREQLLEQQEQLAAMIGLLCMAGSFLNSANPERQAIGRAMAGNVSITSSDEYADFITAQKQEKLAKLETEYREAHQQQMLVIVQNEIDPLTGQLKTED